MNDDLKSRIDKARQSYDERTGVRRKSATESSVGAAMQLGVNFVAAVLIGLVIGLTIDNFAHTGPWGLLIFLAFGIAAGFRNVIRAAQDINRAAQEQAGHGSEQAQGKAPSQGPAGPGASKEDD